jgi:type II secretory pathway pseudopilin PulG
MTPSSFRGYTLVELIVSVGLFALVMTLSAGAYFITINANRQAQGVATGIDSLSFVIERMARSIRTGSNYSCLGAGDCGGGAEFSFVDAGGKAITYRLDSAGSAIEEIGPTETRTLTDTSSVIITSMQFYLSGSSPSDTKQPRVTIVIGGTASVGPGKTKAFLIETGATMRGIDI